MQACKQDVVGLSWKIPGTAFCTVLRCVTCFGLVVIASQGNAVLAERAAGSFLHEQGYGGVPPMHPHCSLVSRS